MGSAVATASFGGCCTANSCRICCQRSNALAILAAKACGSGACDFSAAPSACFAALAAEAWEVPAASLAAFLLGRAGAITPRVAGKAWGFAAAYIQSDLPLRKYLPKTLRRDARNAIAMAFKARWTCGIRSFP